MSYCTKKTTADELACLFHRDTRAEAKPEPFRMNGSLVLLVALETYKSFLLSIPTNSPLIMSASVQTLKKSVNSSALLNYYYFDLVYALAKEVVYAEFYSKDGVCIIPYNDGVEPVSLDNILSSIRMEKTYVDSLQSYLLNAGLRLNTKFKSKHNGDLFKVMYYLFALAIKPSNGSVTPISILV